MQQETPGQKMAPRQVFSLRQMQMPLAAMTMQHWTPLRMYGQRHPRHQICGMAEAHTPACTAPAMRPRTARCMPACSPLWKPPPSLQRSMRQILRMLTPAQMLRQNRTSIAWHASGVMLHSQWTPTRLLAGIFLVLHICLETLMMWALILTQKCSLAA